MPLAELEKQFMQNLTAPDADASPFLAKLLPLKKLSPQQQLLIYLKNINGAHQKVLQQVYPACMNILGEEYFNQLCRDYRMQYPSRHLDLNVYGSEFPRYLQQQLQTRVELHEFGYLSQLAELEWCWHQTYFRKNDPAFDFAALAKVFARVGDDIVFIPSYSLSLFATDYPLVDIWQANREQVAAKQEFVAPDSTVFFAITRVDMTPDISFLNRDEYLVLQALQQRMTISALLNLPEVDASKVNALLTNFVGRGWICGFSLPDDNNV